MSWVESVGNGQTFTQRFDIEKWRKVAFHAENTEKCCLIGYTECPSIAMIANVTAC